MTDDRSKPPKGYRPEWVGEVDQYCLRFPDGGLHRRWFDAKSDAIEASWAHHDLTTPASPATAPQEGE